MFILYTDISDSLLIMEAQNTHKQKGGKKKKIKTLKKKLRVLEEAYQAQQDMLDMTTSYMKSVQLELEQSKRSLEKTNQGLLDSIHYARRIQKAFIPADKTLRQCFPDSFIFARARDIVSGDIPWMHQNGDCSLIAVIDCTGHGAPAAMLSLLAVSLLNQIVAIRNISDPQQILLALDEQMDFYTHNDNMRMKIRDGMDIALCHIDHRLQQLTFAGAHRPLFFVRDGILRQLSGARYAIGENNRERQQLIVNETLSLKKGDSLYLCTDGYGDQFGQESRSRIGSARLKNLLTQISGLDAAQQAEAIDRFFSQWKGNAAQTDDVLMLGIKFTDG